MDAPIQSYFYQQRWIGAGSRGSQRDEGLQSGMGKSARVCVCRRGALYICPVSIATVGLGLQFLTTMFKLPSSEPGVSTALNKEIGYEMFLP